jgi:hypothetical protein
MRKLIISVLILFLNIFSISLTASCMTDNFSDFSKIYKQINEFTIEARSADFPEDVISTIKRNDLEEHALIYQVEQNNFAIIKYLKRIGYGDDVFLKIMDSSDGENYTDCELSRKAGESTLLWESIEVQSNIFDASKKFFKIVWESPYDAWNPLLYNVEMKSGIEVTNAKVTDLNMQTLSKIKSNSMIRVSADIKNTALVERELLYNATLLRDNREIALIESNTFVKSNATKQLSVIMFTMPDLYNNYKVNLKIIDNDSKIIIKEITINAN